MLKWLRQCMALLSTVISHIAQSSAQESALPWCCWHHLRHAYRSKELAGQFVRAIDRGLLCSCGIPAGWALCQGWLTCPGGAACVRRAGQRPGVCSRGRLFSCKVSCLINLNSAACITAPSCCCCPQAAMQPPQAAMSMTCPASTRKPPACPAEGSRVCDQGRAALSCL